jgi:hypothetical protein
MIVAEDEPNRVPGPSATSPTGGVGDGSRTESEELVRLGDGHVSGVESLCVGESQ